MAAGGSGRQWNGTAKTARTVVSSILGLAVRYGVLPHNAMRDVRPAKASAARTTVRDTSRAFTRAERDQVLVVADEHDGAEHADVADLVWFLAGTGVRIGEALTIRWRDLDLDAGSVHVRGTKTAGSTRDLSLPVARGTATGSGSPHRDDRPRVPLARQ